LIEGGDAGVGGYPPQDLAPKDIPGSVVGEGSQAFIFELDPLLVAGDGWQAGVTAKQDFEKHH
jgi:hypothetical protein